MTSYFPIGLAFKLASNLSFYFPIRLGPFSCLPLPTSFAFSFNLTLVLHAPSVRIGIGGPKTISWSCVYQSSRFFRYFSKQFFLPINAGRRFFQQEREEKCKHSAFWDVRLCVRVSVVLLERGFAFFPGFVVNFPCRAGESVFRTRKKRSCHYKCRLFAQLFLVFG